MNKKNIIIGSLGLLLTSSLANAADPAALRGSVDFDNKKEEVPEYVASAELGMLLKSGNIDSADLRAGFDLTWQKDLWRSVFDFDLLVKKLDQLQPDNTVDLETVDHRILISSKTNYILNPENKSYLYGDIAYEDNRISNFDNQATISAGWGREWFNDEVSSLTADIGPGYRRDVVRFTGEINTAFIIQAQALYLRKINSNVDFRQTLSIKYAPKSGANSQYTSESAITAQLIDALQMKFSFRMNHNSEVQAGLKKTDTETAVTLIYSF